MNERSKSDLLFEEDEEFIDALEEAVEALNMKTEVRSDDNEIHSAGSH